jgi:hypothetical protein
VIESMKNPSWTLLSMNWNRGCEKMGLKNPILHSPFFFRVDFVSCFRKKGHNPPFPIIKIICFTAVFQFSEGSVSCVHKAKQDCF